jgi:hypothetical protein
MRKILGCFVVSVRIWALGFFSLIGSLGSLGSLLDLMMAIGVYFDFFFMIGREEPDGQSGWGSLYTMIV